MYLNYFPSPSVLEKDNKLKITIMGIIVKVFVFIILVFIGTVIIDDTTMFE